MWLGSRETRDKGNKEANLKQHTIKTTCPKTQKRRIQSHGFCRHTTVSLSSSSSGESQLASGGTFQTFDLHIFMSPLLPWIVLTTYILISNFIDAGKSTLMTGCASYFILNERHIIPITVNVIFAKRPLLREWATQTRRLDHLL